MAKPTEETVAEEEAAPARKTSSRFHPDSLNRGCLVDALVAALAAVVVLGLALGIGIAAA